MAMIGLDWGSSSLRAMRLGAGGEVLELRQSAAGASTLHGRAEEFAAALDALIPDWHEGSAPILACGMVGSQHGWREVPYADGPADAGALMRLSLAVDWRGRPVRLLPGLRCSGAAGAPDLMRGEETQVLGALQLEPTLAAQSCLVLPGTHSKWAQVQDGCVAGFATQMTGELFAVLRQHSVLGRLMPAEADPSPEAFEQGVAAARDHGEAGLPNQLFGVRSLGLAARIVPEGLADYLSGLLIGHELRAGLAWREARGLNAAPLRLIGEPALCERYAHALALFGEPGSQALSNTAPAGLWRLANQGGL
ncbi:2-dehydro-3-deoxygalactonokinase [Pelomonas aquatica]|nr:2-dehydro-3-deoxygalactonokinase [Pelomonas aquatica]MCY4753069.1 2-dehydro-3-deoxygalactonokinase [Pelomonas aquatica]